MITTDVQLSSLSGDQIAKHFGCHYQGDANPLNGGYFYSLENWAEHGYADAVSIEVIEGRFCVEYGAIRKACDENLDELVEEFESFGGETELRDNVHWQVYGSLEGGFDCQEDFGGAYRKWFDADVDEDRFWDEITNWLEWLGTPADV
jgi:hypothetical protein